MMFFLLIYFLSSPSLNQQRQNIADTSFNLVSCQKSNELEISAMEVEALIDSLYRKLTEDRKFGAPRYSIYGDLKKSSKKKLLHAISSITKIDKEGIGHAEFSFTANLFTTYKSVKFHLFYYNSTGRNEQKIAGNKISISIFGYIEFTRASTGERVIIDNFCSPLTKMFLIVE